MNIGSLIRGLLGEQKPGDAKTLELKPGQVVRGVVMNVSEDGQEAVVQIQGVQVKAKLETPLRAGKRLCCRFSRREREGRPCLSLSAKRRDSRCPRHPWLRCWILRVFRIRRKTAK